MAHDTLITLPLTLDGTGDVDATNEQMAVNGTTPAQFWIGPAALGHEIILLKRLLIFIEDAGVWTSEKFGAITGGIANGIRFDITDLSFNSLANLSPIPIKNNAQWRGKLCYDAIIDSVGAGNSFLSARWSLFKDNKNNQGHFINAAQKFVCTVQDDLSTLDDFTIIVKGEIIK